MTPPLEVLAQSSGVAGKQVQRKACHLGLWAGVMMNEISALSKCSGHLLLTGHVPCNVCLPNRFQYLLIQYLPGRC